MCAVNGLTEDRSAYLQEENFAKKLICTSASFPDQVFHHDLRFFIFFNFDDFFTKDFFDGLTQFLRRNREGNETFTLFTIRPDPEDYFYENFGCYPILRSSTLWMAEKYLSVVFADPGNSPADAIAYNSMELVLHSQSLDWCIYGNRDFEIGVMGAKEKRYIDKWQAVYQNCFAVESIIAAVLRPARGSSTLPSQYIEKLRQHYR